MTEFEQAIDALDAAFTAALRGLPDEPGDGNVDAYTKSEKRLLKSCSRVTRLIAARRCDVYRRRDDRCLALGYCTPITEEEVRSIKWPPRA